MPPANRLSSKGSSSMATKTSTGDSSSPNESRHCASPPPASIPHEKLYSPPPPAPRCVGKMFEAIEPAPDFVWHEINTGHSILNPKISKAPIPRDWGMSMSEYERFEDTEDVPHASSRSNRVLSIPLSYPELYPPGSPDDISDGVDDDMPHLPSSINLSMRKEKKPPLSPLLSMRFYGNCFIPIRHDFNDVVDEVDENDSG